MDDQRTAVVVVVVGVLILAAGAALVANGGLQAGGGPPLSADGSATTDTSGTASDGSGDGAATGGGTDDGSDGAADRAPYGFTIDRIEGCGTTCREVTATLTNTGNETRSDVRVNTKLLADGDELWEGDQTVGDMESGEAFTETRTVDVGYWGGVQIQRNDGYVTIRTTVTSEQGTVTFEERRKVA